MRFRVVVEFDSLAGAYAVFCPELPGCVSAGDTEAEALANIKESIAIYLEPSDLQTNGKIVEVELAT